MTGTPDTPFVAFVGIIGVLMVVIGLSVVVLGYSAAASTVAAWKILSDTGVHVGKGDLASVWRPWAFGGTAMIILGLVLTSFRRWIAATFISGFAGDASPSGREVLRSVIIVVGLVLVSVSSAGLASASLSAAIEGEDLRFGTLVFLVVLLSIGCVLTMRSRWILRLEGRD